MTSSKPSLRSRLLFLFYDIVLMSAISFGIVFAIKSVGYVWSTPEYCAMLMLLAGWTAVIWRFVTGRGTFPYELIEELMR